MKRSQAVIVALLSAAGVAGCGGGENASFSTASPHRQQRPVTFSAAAAADYSSAAQQLYIAYFGRPADPTGLANFSAALAQANAPTTTAGISSDYATNSAIKSLVDAFGASAESNELYTGNTESFVDAIYQNLFNRCADTSGLGFWANAIDSGMLTKGNAALSIMAGAASNTSTQGLADAATINTKTAVASNFTAALNTASAVIGYSGDTAASNARSMLAVVNNATDTSAFQATINSTIESFSIIYTMEGRIPDVPGAPGIGSATAGNASASISFTAPSWNGGAAITGYTVSCTGGGSTVNGTNITSPITVSGLTNGTNYICSVRATNAVGSSRPSSVVFVTPAASGSGTTSTRASCSRTAGAS